MSGTGTLYETSVPDEDIPDDQIDDGTPPADEPDEAALAHAAAEAEARKAGWRPLAEYKGPPGQWRTAEEFLKRGQDILPMVRKDLLRERERGNNMEAEIKALRTTVDDQKAVMEDLLKMARTASEAGYKRALEELKAQKRQAAQAGDIAGVVAIDEKISEVEEAREAAPPQREPVPPPANPKVEPKVKVDPVVEQFVLDNPWFTNDPVLHRAMETEHMALLESDRNLTLEENLERAKEAVMARFPRKFGINPDSTPPADPPRRRVNGVSPPSPPTQTGRRPATGIASIEDPQERAVAQQAFARARRLMPDLGESEWFAAYDNPKVDIRDVLQAAKQKVKKS